MSEPIDYQTLRAAALTSEELLARVTAEMQHLHDSGAGMRLEMHPGEAFAVVAMCQLALRHPGTLTNASTALVRDVIERVRAKFEPHAPAIALAIERGNEPEYDTPRQPSPELLCCPFCGHIDPAPFERVDVYICAGCGRTIETA